MIEENTINNKNRERPISFIQIGNRSGNALAEAVLADKLKQDFQLTRWRVFEEDA
ncbi:MAG: hypothetical protein IOC56_02130 [Methylobacterium sp.]|nr:hypothetical protein [Methylobacterium sp.]MCA3619873.1 hypothetical protein [Methylobacterium sp.]